MLFAHDKCGGAAFAKAGFKRVDKNRRHLALGNVRQQVLDNMLWQGCVHGGSPVGLLLKLARYIPKGVTAMDCGPKAADSTKNLIMGQPAVCVMFVVTHGVTHGVRHGAALASHRGGHRGGSQASRAHTRSTSAPYACSFLTPMPATPSRSRSRCGSRSAMARSVAS